MKKNLESKTNMYDKNLEILEKRHDKISIVREDLEKPLKSEMTFKPKSTRTTTAEG